MFIKKVIRINELPNVYYYLSDDDNVLELVEMEVGGPDLTLKYSYPVFPSSLPILHYRSLSVSLSISLSIYISVSLLLDRRLSRSVFVYLTLSLALSLCLCVCVFLLFLNLSILFSKYNQCKLLD